MTKVNKRKTRKERKRLMFISFTMLILLVILSASVYKNFMQIINNKKETIALNEEYDELLSEKDSLTSEVTKMQDPNYIARYAKEKYLYSSDGEVILRVD